MLLNILKIIIFPLINYAVQHKNYYICIVFFMVLDLRLTKEIGLSG
jgi:hypothetical protein